MTLRTFDVWDTLLRRRCHPDEVKLYTAWHLFMRLRDRLRDPEATPWTLFDARIAAERAVAAERRAAGFDPEYEITEVFLRWIHATLRLRGGRRARYALAADLAEVETTQELKVAYADPRAVGLAREPNEGALVAVSDFYMSSDRLARILGRHAPGVRFDRVFSSCDHRLNKRSGRLFRHVHQETASRPDRHTHVGNSPGADIEPARALGVRAVLFRHPAEDAIAAAHHSRFLIRGPGRGVDLRDLDAELRRSCPAPADLRGEQRRLFALGRHLAPLFCGLVLRAIEDAARFRIRTVHYFTREGEFFARLHRAMARVRPAGLRSPRPRVLEVSRVATFFPSLREFSPDELMRLWNLYASQSMAQLLRSLGVPQIGAEPFLAAHRIDPSERIRFPWTDERVRALLADPLFVRLLEQARDRRRAETLEFLASHGFRNDGRARLIVDIGWRGTIQDNLAYLFPDTPIHGVYLGLQPLLNDQPPNTSKATFGPDARHDHPTVAALLRFVAPLEMICNSGSGSVRGYQRRPDGGMTAIRQEHADETAVYARYTRFLQQGAVAAAPAVADWCSRHAVWSDELRPPCLKRLRELVLCPDRVLARAFFSLAHDEMFGEGGVVRKFGRLPLGLAWGADRSRERWDAFARFLDTTSWPQGFLVLNRRRSLLARYNQEALDAAAQPPESAGPRLGTIEAKRQLEQLERSRAWRAVTSIKRNPAYRVYARRRWGPAWDLPPEFETPEDRLARLQASRTYKLIVRARSSRLYRLLARAPAAEPP